MIIGNFRFDAASDIYTGEIRTLSVQRGNVVLRPVDRRSDREPDYRVVQHGDGGTVELGAAWRRRSDKGQDYLSVLLDDPTLPQALSVALFQGDDDTSASLVWNRPARKAPEAAAKPTQPAGRRRNNGRAEARPV